MAIDEARGNFPPTLWYLDRNCLNEDGTPKVNLKQVWFPGYHSDVGGHSKGSIDTNSVDEITFAWMCDQLHGLVQLDVFALERYILFRLGPTPVQWDLPGKQNIRDLEARWRQIQWSNGTLEDNNGWLNGWWIPSLMSTAKASYYRVPGETKVLEDGKKTPIDYRRFNEEVHPSVHQRVADTKGKYQPTPFRKGWVYVAPTETERGHWKKKAGGKEVILYEYTIPDPERMPEKLSRELYHWRGSLERVMAPKEVLAAQAPFVKSKSSP